jgi:hypothetical protein
VKTFPDCGGLSILMEGISLATHELVYWAKDPMTTSWFTFVVAFEFSALSVSEDSRIAATAPKTMPPTPRGASDLDGRSSIKPVPSAIGQDGGAPQP